MARRRNIFHNLVTDENSMTELLCNLMQFRAFHRPFFSRFLSPSVVDAILFDDIQTQVPIEGGRPDLLVRTDELTVVIEVKVSNGQGLTPNQPDGYYRYLCNDGAPHKCLVFLVPQGWLHESALTDTFALLRSGALSPRVQTHICHWEDVIDLIEANDLAELSPFIAEFRALLQFRYRSPTITFSNSEVAMLFTKEFPNALSKLEGLMLAVQAKSNAYPSDLSKWRKLFADEYGLYFRTAAGQPILWFGVWSAFWLESGFPLCFGVQDKWLPMVRETFTAKYAGKTRRCEDWTVTWVSESTLRSEDPAEEIWHELEAFLAEVKSLLVPSPAENG
jgi:hypothetical protein